LIGIDAVQVRFIFQKHNYFSSQIISCMKTGQRQSKDGCFRGRARSPSVKNIFRFTRKSAGYAGFCRVYGISKLHLFDED
jgi:hypothetical protein